MLGTQKFDGQDGIKIDRRCWKFGRCVGGSLYVVWPNMSKMERCFPKRIVWVYEESAEGFRLPAEETPIDIRHVELVDDHTLDKIHRLN